MSKSKNKSRYFMTAVLCALIAVTTSVASIMSGCGCEKTEPVSASTSAEQTYATDSKQTSSSTTTSSDSSETSENVSDSTSAANSSNGSGTETGSDNPESTKTTGSPNNATHSSTKVCTVDGTKFYVGDTVTSVYSLTSPETLVNFQAYITYDSKYLKVTSADFKNSARSSSVLNYETIVDKIAFNGSNISSGYKYSNGGEFLVVTYEVLAEGSTTTSFKWEAARGLDSMKSYVNNGIPDAGLKISLETL